MDYDEISRRINHPPTSRALTFGESPTHFASVSAVFRPGPELLLIRRAVVEGDPWSGHVAFPGGRHEPEDPDALATAVRETREEVGIDLSGARLLGALHPVRPMPLAGRTLEVRPFAWGLPTTEVTPSPSDEVARTFWVPLQDLLDGKGRSTLRYPWQGAEIILPCVHLGEELLWGLTLRIVDDLLDRLRAGRV